MAVRLYQFSLVWPTKCCPLSTVYHVLNRGIGRKRLFQKDGDYEAFERVLTEGLGRYPVDLLTYCLIPNHWHVVVRPKTDEARSGL